MSRFRRNNAQQGLPFAGTETPPLRSTRLPSLRGVVPLGIVVNPRTREPLLVVTDGENVGIRSLKANSVGFRHGTGYYDTSGHGKSKEAENLTGFPRSHTPSGVAPRGAGYGTSLYTALALGAYLVDNTEADIHMDARGEGISSESEGRSREADTWWNAALARGLTRREVDESEETEEGVDLDLYADDLEGCVSLDEGQSLAYVNRVNVDITTKAELNVDTYRYFVKGSAQDGAWNNDLVLVEFHMNDTEEGKIPDDLPRGSELRWLADLAQEDEDFWGDTNPTALLASDIRGLDKEAVKLMSVAFARAELSDRDIDAMWQRWRHNLDPSGSGQQHLFSRNARGAALADVVEARNLVPWDYLAPLP